MAAGVFGQVVAAHEALGAERAGEAFLASVGAEMARQLIRTREALGAVEPCALERSLAWKRDDHEHRTTFRVQ